MKSNFGRSFSIRLMPVIGILVLLSAACSPPPLHEIEVTLTPTIRIIPAEGQAVVVVDAPLRSHPNTQAEVIRILSIGDVVNLLGMLPSEEWYLVQEAQAQVGQDEGWILAKFVDTIVTETPGVEPTNAPTSSGAGIRTPTGTTTTVALRTPTATTTTVALRTPTATTTTVALRTPTATTTSTPPVPMVIIVSPGDGDRFSYDGYDTNLGLWYADIEFVGLASDPVYGALSGNQLQWTTDRIDIQDAFLGTGTDLVARLYSNVCEGVNHNITLVATNNVGFSSRYRISITIWNIC